MKPRYVYSDQGTLEVVNMRIGPCGIVAEITPKKNAVIVEFHDDMCPTIYIECINEDLYPTLNKAALNIYDNL